MLARVGVEDEVPIGVETVMVTEPADSAGATTSQSVLVQLPTIVAAVLPNSTTVAPEKPSPAIVTGVPPVVDPVDGVTEEIVGLELPTITFPS